MHDSIEQFEQVIAPPLDISIDAAMPYLKALALVTTLLSMWAGLCAI